MGTANRAFRNVWRKKSRIFAVVFALGFAIAAVVSMYSGVEASRENTQVLIDESIATTEEMMADYEEYLYEQENLTSAQLRQIVIMNFSFGGVRPEAGGGGFSGRMLGPITESDIENISAMEMVETVVPTTTETYGDDRRDPDYIVTGAPLDPTIDELYQVLPSNIIEGDGLTEDGPGCVVMSGELVDFFGAGVGEYIEIDGLKFKVVGLFDSGFGTPEIVMSIGDSQVLFGLEEDEYNNLNVYTVDADDVEMVVYDIEENFTSYRVFSYADQSSRFADIQKMQSEAQILEMQLAQEDEEERLNTEFARIEDTGSQVMGVSLAMAILIVMFMMLYSVKERTKEIGVLKALGFTKSSIMGQFVAEGTIIGLLGGLVGFTIAIVAAPILSDVFLSGTDAYGSVSVDPVLLLTALVLSCTLGAAGSLYPAWSGASKKPVEAIRNE